MLLAYWSYDGQVSDEEGLSVHQAYLFAVDVLPLRLQVPANRARWVRNGGVHPTPAGTQAQCAAVSHVAVRLQGRAVERAGRDQAF